MYVRTYLDKIHGERLHSPSLESKVCGVERMGTNIGTQVQHDRRHGTRRLPLPVGGVGVFGLFGGVFTAVVEPECLGQKFGDGSFPGTPVKDATGYPQVQGPGEGAHPEAWLQERSKRTTFKS